MIPLFAKVEQINGVWKWTNGKKWKAVDFIFVLLNGGFDKR